MPSHRTKVVHVYVNLENIYLYKRVIRLIVLKRSEKDLHPCNTVKDVVDDDIGKAFSLWRQNIKI